MYIFELLEEERILKIAIESLEKEIYYMEKDGENIDPLIKRLVVTHDSLESAYAELGETKDRLKEVHKNMRKVLMCE